MPYTPGPYDRKHLRITWGGKLPGNEDWSCSINMAAVDGLATITGNNNFIDAMDTSGAFLDSVATAVSDYHTRATTHIAASGKLTYVKVAKIEVDGRYPADYNASEHVFSSIGGGGGNEAIPNQIALAVSLTTDVTRGPAHRGRFYLPVPAAFAVPTDGLISASVATDVTASTRTFLEALSDFPGIDTPVSPEVVVMSRKSGAPRTREVTGVAVGRVLDTQRRRRRSLPETYSHDVVDFGAA